MLDAGRGSRDTGHGTRDTGHGTRDAGRGTRERRCGPTRASHGARGRVSERQPRSPDRPLERTAAPGGGAAASEVAYSHSIVAGGFELTSYTTRFTPSTSLAIRLEIWASTSGGKGNQSAVMPSRLVTARRATT